jgi:hypothetical protein
MSLDKKPLVRDRKWLDSLRNGPCIVTLQTGSSPSCEPAHLRLLGSGGTGSKPSDARALPLHYELHKLEQRLGPRAFWAQMIKDYPDLLWRLLIEVAELRYDKYKGNKDKS